MAEVTIDVLKAQLVRQYPSEHWGLQLQGGADFGQPLTILKVAPDSPASRIGLQVGDILTGIDGISTTQMKRQEAIDLVDLQKGSLLVTVERRVTGSAIHSMPFSEPTASPAIKSYQPFDISGSTREPRTRRTRPQPAAHFTPSTTVLPVNPVVPQQHQQLQDYNRQSQQYAQPRGYQGYQPVDLSGPRYYQPAQQKKPEDFTTVVSRPFVDYKRNTPTPHPESFPSDLPPARHYWTPTPQYLSNEESPQSRTFRMLQSVMENEEPYAGVDGLPPPRSASREQMKQEMQFSRASPRVKVLMAQKYNSPLGIYSAENVIESFKGQAETALGSMEQLQRPNMNQHTAVYASNRQ